MFPSFWSFLPATDAMFQYAQRELDRMQERCDTSIRTLFDPRSVPTRTPSDVVHAEHRLQILRYRPQAAQLQPIPMLIVPSLLNRSDLLDLAPGRSLIEYLVSQGIDLYLLDWRAPTREDWFITFEQYITGYLRRAVSRVRALSGQPQISLLGYSMGGTLTAIFTSLYGQHVRNLIQLAAPIDFSDGGLLAAWTRREHFNVDLVVDTLGAMPLELMRASFRLLKPTTQIAQQILQAEQFGDMDAIQDLLAMLAWISDDIPLLGEAYRTYIKDCYQSNYLVQGKMLIDGKRINLANIGCALLTITATNDYICPSHAAAALNRLVGSTDQRLLEIPGGHISIVAGRDAPSQLWPQLANWLRAHSQAPEPAPTEPSPVEAPPTIRTRTRRKKTQGDKAENV